MDEGKRATEGAFIHPDPIFHQKSDLVSGTHLHFLLRYEQPVPEELTMALALTFLPQRLMDKTDEKLLHCYSRLELVRDYDLFQLIGETGRSSSKTIIKPKPVPSNWKVEVYGEAGLYETAADAYGEPITYTTAGQLGSLPIPDNTHDWNKAVWAFLGTLPESTIVLLWWH